MKRSLIIGCPTPVRNFYPSDISCFKFHLFYFLGIQSVKSRNVLIFHTKKGFSLRKIPIGCSKVKPYFQNVDAKNFLGEWKRKRGLMTGCPIQFKGLFGNRQGWCRSVFWSYDKNAIDLHNRFLMQFQSCLNRYFVVSFLRIGIYGSANIHVG